MVTPRCGAVLFVFSGEYLEADIHTRKSRGSYGVWKIPFKKRAYVHEIWARCSCRPNGNASVLASWIGFWQLADGTSDNKTQQFQLLVAAVISSQTRDSVTAAAMTRLHALPGGLTVGNLSKQELTIHQLAEILKPVGFYRQKAKHLKAIVEKLSAQPFDGHVPNTLDELLKLPGVGPKIALLVLWVAFGKGEEGFIVDTNVRRVCCRLGWAPDDSDPNQVRESLETWLPRSLWPDISFLFVGFGQQVCKPIAPQCGICQVKNMCPSALQYANKEMSKKRSKLK